MSRFVLPLNDFNRIHQVAHGVLRDVGDIKIACTWFNIFGAFMLEQQYGIKARPMAGGFAMCVAENRNLIYGREDDGEWIVDDEGYHMWVETPTHVLDFTSPIYREVFSVAQPDIVLPRKMVQKPIGEQKATLDEIQAVGDFLVMPDARLTALMIQRFMAKPASTDLIQIATHWFGNRRAKQRGTSQMINDLGEVTTLSLPPVVANGAW